MTKHGVLPRVILAALTIGFQAGCMSWQVASKAPSPASAEMAEGRNDSLTGNVAPAPSVRRVRTVAIAGGVAALGVLSFVAVRAGLRGLVEFRAEDLEFLERFDSCFWDLVNIC